MLAFDAHVDTVDVGNPANWTVHPFEGGERDGIIYGRGASDMKGALASIVYGGRLIKELGLEGGSLQSAPIVPLNGRVSSWSAWSSGASSPN